jgi:hypothetical protein
MEGAYAILTGEVTQFSEQQLMDCVPESRGCNGGWAHKGFDYYKTAKPMKMEDYPYLDAK